MKAANYLSFLFLVSASLATARPVRALTLAEAIGYALEHNRDVLSMKEEIRERRGQVIEARSDAFPKLDLILSGYRLRDPGFLNSTFGQELLRGGGGSDFPIPIEAILPKPQTYYQTTLSFSQPLFTWGKVSNALKVATLGMQDIDLGLETTRQQVAYDVSSAFYDVLLAEETIDMYQKAIETRQRFLQQTKDLFEVGDATRLDILRAESQLASTRPDLLEAENRLTQAMKQLNFLMGRELIEPVNAVGVEAHGDFTAPPLDSVVTVAVHNRPDLHRLEIQQDMYDKTINVFKADYRPRADLNGYYGYSTIRTGDLLDRNFEAWRFALEFKVPVFDGLKNRGIVMQYRSQQARKRIERDKLAEQIRLQSRQAIDACTSQAEVYQARKLSLESAEEEERVTGDQYDQGLVTLFELLEANRRTLETTVDYLRSRYDLLRQIANLKLVMGIIVYEL
ncbi:MAG: TolC family protein [Candidatus Glassbacteria bacterium]